jgi:O-antigen ligase
MVLAQFHTVSRGALAAAGVGVVLQLVLARDRSTVRCAAIAVVAGGLLTLLAFRFPAVENLHGDAADRRLQGLGVLALLLAASGGAALAQRGRPSGRVGAAVAAALVAAVVAVTLVVAAGIPEPAPAPQPRATPSSGPAGAALTPGSGRLRSIESNRYSYWKVALRGFGDHPLEGGGAHSFAALWLRERSIAEPVQDAHSLYLETLTELGLVGFALLLLFLGAVTACALALWRAGPAERTLTSGWLAAEAVLLVHAGLDWDWEMPALGLMLVILAGAVVAARDGLRPE